MKKISALLFGLLISSATFAQVAGGTYQLEGSGPITTDQCGLLNENVTINLTTGVNAGVDCDGERIAISACHTAGRTVARQVDRPTPVGCGVPDPTTGETVACTGTERVTATGASMATATTLAGTVTPEYPGELCSAAAAAATAAEQ
ncbi:hypothetical protein [Thauera propionica]|uniref:hypothetical protein n=1 Tax=Thauera propionica TaxID=2019431 RepID=UPI001054E2E3|nr:hypothetical protein [Thauera propionica]